jgi:hypothetical protein
MDGIHINAVEPQHRGTPAFRPEGGKSLGITIIVKGCGGTEKLGSGETSLAASAMPTYLVHGNLLVLF